MLNKVMDVVVIGGGVVGNAILHALSKYELDVMLVEKQLDVCEGASKANSGIICTGFDSTPGTVETKCLQLSQKLWPTLIEQLKIPYLECGAMMVATNEEEKTIIFEKYIPNAAANGVDVQWVSKEEVLEMNPAVSEDIEGGLVIPKEAVCDPFWATRSFGELAVLNGAEILLGHGVEQIIEKDDEASFELVLDGGKSIETRYIVNAAGLWADDIARMIGDDSFSLTPRKGQFILTEDPVPISQIILPVPTPKSKGILVTPVVFGGFLIGPTAEDQSDKWDRTITQDGMEMVLNGSSKLVPNTKNYSTIRQFAGVRAVSSEGDFIIRASDYNPHMIYAAGIRSTGISSAPGIAQFVLEILQKSGLALNPMSNYIEELPGLFGDEEETNVGEIVCLCRSITRGEILGALNRPLASATIDGIKRRTGATLGECQGNCCIPKIIDIMNEHTDTSNRSRPMKGLKDSYIAVKGD